MVLKKEEVESAIREKSLFYITIPPHSDFEIHWASAENSDRLDSKIEGSGPFSIAVITD